VQPWHSPHCPGTCWLASAFLPSTATGLPISPSCLLPVAATRLPPGSCVVLDLLWCLVWLPLRPLPPRPHGTTLRLAERSRWTPLPRTYAAAWPSGLLCTVLCRLPWCTSSPLLT
jgi:hypothetical protein